MDDHIKSLFKRYQEGTATAEERALVEMWFESHYGQKGRMLSRNEEASVFEDLDARIALMLAETDVSIIGSNGEPAAVSRLNFRWMQVAAMFLALLGSGLFIRNKFSKKSILPETFTEIRSLNGEKKEVTLKDGTTVFLNSGSSVFVSSRFDGTKREVKLSGEAFFQVHHNANKPFIIHSGKLQTTVLGTSFDIKAYPEDEHVKVSVATGKVKVEKPDTETKPELFAKALTHNQALVYDKVRNRHHLTTVNVDSISAWRTNHLNFDNASYEEIARMLSRWYNLEVTLNANHHDHKRYTLSFYNERPDKVLNVLSALTGMTYTIDGRKVLINPKNQSLNSL